MSSGSWNRGNGVSVASPGNPRIYWTRTWSGGDSIQVRTERHTVDRTVIKTVGYRKVTYMQYRKAKNGKSVWVKRELLQPIKAVTSVSSTRNVHFRISTPEDAKGLYPASIVSLLPTALRKREDDAGLNESSPLVERLNSTPIAKSTDRNPARPPKRARLADNAYTMSEHYVRDVAGYLLQDTLVQGQPRICSAPWQINWAYSAFAVEDWTPAFILPANRHFILLNKVREKVLGSDFNMGVALGELHESVDLITNSAVRIGRYMTAMKRGNFKAAHKALFDPPSRSPIPPGKAGAPTAKQLSSAHLELHYGWKPLLNDVVGAAEALAHQLNVPYQRTYRVSILAKQKLSRQTDVPTYCNVQGFPIYAKAEREHRRSWIVKFREKPTLPKLLGLLDPEVVAWELVPFSFIADWFIPVGDWLTARGFAQGLNATIVESDKMTGKAYEPQGKGLFKHSSLDGVYFCSKVNFSRAIISSPSVPKPAIKPLSEIATWRHATDAVALLISNHGGRGYK